MLCGKIRELMIWYTFLFLSSYKNMTNSSFIPSYKRWDWKIRSALLKCFQLESFENRVTYLFINGLPRHESWGNVKEPKSISMKASHAKTNPLENLKVLLSFCANWLGVNWVLVDISWLCKLISSCKTWEIFSQKLTVSTECVSYCECHAASRKDFSPWWSCTVSKDLPNLLIMWVHMIHNATQ